MPEKEPELSSDGKHPTVKTESQPATFNLMSLPILKGLSTFGINDFAYSSFLPDHGGLKIFANLEGE